MPKPTYSELLRDPRWQRKRLEILNRDNFSCQSCYDSESTLHVHHKHYVKGRMPWEYEEFELVTLCESCHGQEDESDLEKKLLLAKLRDDGPYSLEAGLALIAGWANNNCGHDLSEWSDKSPYEFLLGEVADIIDVFVWRINELMELRDILRSLPADRRREAVDRLMDAAKGLKED